MSVSKSGRGEEIGDKKEMERGGVVFAGSDQFPCQRSHGNHIAAPLLALPYLRVQLCVCVRE